MCGCKLQVFIAVLILAFLSLHSTNSTDSVISLAVVDREASCMHEVLLRAPDHFTPVTTHSWVKR